MSLLARPVPGSFARKLDPDLFAEDLKFIRHLGLASDLREVSADAEDFRDVNRGKPSFLSVSLRIRVPGRKAARLAHQLFSEARRDAA